MNSVYLRLCVYAGYPDTGLGHQCEHNFSLMPAPKFGHGVHKHWNKILTLYSGTGSSTDTSLHAIFVSAQVFYPHSPQCPNCQHGRRVEIVEGGIEHINLASGRLLCSGTKSECGIKQCFRFTCTSFLN